MLVIMGDANQHASIAIRSGQLDLERPAGIVDGFDPWAKLMLPIAITLRLIPAREPIQHVHAAMIIERLRHGKDSRLTTTYRRSHARAPARSPINRPAAIRRKTSPSAVAPFPAVRSIGRASRNRPFHQLSEVPFLHVRRTVSGKRNRERVLGECLTGGIGIPIVPWLSRHAFFFGKLEMATFAQALPSPPYSGFPPP